MALALSSCYGVIPKNDICGTEASWEGLQQERIYPASYKAEVEEHCSLDVCRPSYYHKYCSPLIKLSRMTLPPAGQPPEKRLRVWIEGIAKPLADATDSQWYNAIQTEGLTPKGEIEEVNTPAVLHWKPEAYIALEEIKGAIKAEPDGKHKEYLIELYAIADQYGQLAFDPSGHTLQSYRDKKNALDAQAATIFSKLEFAQ